MGRAPGTRLQTTERISGLWMSCGSASLRSGSAWTSASLSSSGVSVSVLVFLQMADIHRRHMEILFGGLGQGAWGTEVPQRGPGAEPRWGSGWQSPQKVKYNVKFIPLKNDLTTCFCHVLLVIIIHSECYNINIMCCKCVTYGTTIHICVLWTVSAICQYNPRK